MSGLQKSLQRPRIRRINIRSIIYRIRQFIDALIGEPDDEWMARVKEVLTDEQQELFLSLQPFEQVHAIKVFRKLIERGIDSFDLLVAALLHDVGKTLHPLSFWDRVIGVLASVLLPEKFRQWGSGSPDGWRKPFVVACQHPGWGAELATASGVSPLTGVLICHHHDDTAVDTLVEGREFLKILQEIDRES